MFRAFSDIPNFWHDPAPLPVWASGAFLITILVSSLGVVLGCILLLKDLP